MFKHLRVCIQMGSCKKFMMTFTARLTIQSYMKGKIALDHVGLRSGNFGRRKSFFTFNEMQGCDHDGFSSGNFGWKGTFFSSQTKANVVLNQDGPRRSGKFGRGRVFSSSHPKLRILLKCGYFGWIVAFLTSLTRGLFLTTLSLNS